MNLLALILERTLAGSMLPQFDRYVCSFGVSKWLILTDYCIGHTGYPNDVFIYTVIPGDRFLLHADQIKAVLPKDLKQCRQIDQPLLAFIRRPELFTFAFVLPQGSKFFRDKEQVQEMADKAVEMMEQWPNAASHAGSIRQFKGLRQEAIKTNFGVKLHNQMILAPTFAAFIGLQLAKRTRLTALAWYHDQDNIHSKLDGLADTIFHLNLHSFCLQFNLPEVETVGWIDYSKPQSKEFEPYTRIPDFFAGPIAYLDFRNAREDGYIPHKSEKYGVITENLLANNPNLGVFLLDLGEMRFSTGNIALKPFPPRL